MTDSKADPKAPDGPEYAEVACPHCETLLRVDLDELRVALMAVGLAIVSEADRKVLEFLASTPTLALRQLARCRNIPDIPPALRHAAEAELEARKTREK